MLYNREAKYFPTGQLTDTGPYNFRIPSESGLMIDTATCRLEGKLQLMKVDPTNNQMVNMVDTDDAMLINMFPAALFRSIEVSLNGTMVSYVSSPASHYRAYIETCLSYGLDAARTHLQSSRFYIDAPSKFDKLTETDLGKDSPANSRRRLTTVSKVVDFCTPLHSDILRVDRLLPDRMSMDINLTREDDKFVIMASENKYKIKILELSLHIKKIANKPSYVGAVNQKMDNGDRSRFPLVRSIVKTRQIPRGTTFTSLNDIFSGRFDLITKVNYLHLSS